MINIIHTPIMLRETIRSLNIKKNGIYIDCTYGSGGHTKAILKKLDFSGKLIIIDKDYESYKDALKLNNLKTIVFHENFSKIFKIIKKLNLINKIDGILTDLGPSTTQIKDFNRGFSFHSSSPLDMRMNIKNKFTLKKWLLKVNEKKLENIISNYSDEKKAKKIAYLIKKNIKNINTTLELSNLIKKITFNKNKHPATRTFLALRMYINNEIEELKILLYSIYSILKKNGIFCILTFNSTERKILSHFYYNKNIINNEKKLLLKYQLKPSNIEIFNNKNSRSSILHVFIKK